MILSPPMKGQPNKVILSPLNKTKLKAASVSPFSYATGDKKELELGNAK